MLALEAHTLNSGLLYLSHSFILKNYDIQYFSMRDIDRLGIQKVMEQTFDLLIGK